MDMNGNDMIYGMTFHWKSQVTRKNHQKTYLCRTGPDMYCPDDTHQKNEFHEQASEGALRPEIQPCHLLLHI